MPENYDNDPCDPYATKFNAIPLSTQTMPQFTRDSKSSEAISDNLSVSTYQFPPQTTHGKPKHKPDGSIDCYKARLVTKGYTQTYEVDYLETFAPLAKLNDFDVRNAFLHDDLKEEIYMDLPSGIPVTSKEGVVCKLRKSLYRLKHSPKAWFGRFAAYMKKFGYVKLTPGKGLMFSKYGHTYVEGYTDVDWAGSITDKSST
ncbi:unnamed protein product [Prunus armeniaca]